MEAQTWWNKNIETKLETFKGWVGDSNAPTKVYMATYLKDKNYNSILDAGCATATFYHTLKNNSINIEYIGVDSCKFFVEMNNKEGIFTVENDIRNMTNFSDNSVDVVFSRHTLEHQPTFTHTLDEFIRVAKKEACHIFFIPPEQNEIIDYDSKLELYHNKYSISNIENYLRSKEKVASWRWVNNISSRECTLHIYMK